MNDKDDQWLVLGRCDFRIVDGLETQELEICMDSDPHNIYAYLSMEDAVKLWGWLDRRLQQAMLRQRAEQ